MVATVVPEMTLSHAILHFCGLNNTAGLFSIEWYLHFPDVSIGGECREDFYTTLLPRRFKHNMFVWFVLSVI